MNAIEAMKGRRTARDYKDQPIPREVLEDIVDCARLAPSAINIQPWEFVVVTDAAMRRRIADATDHGKHIATGAACILVFCKDSRYYLEDGCAATQNILLAAWAHGIACCWIAGDKKDYADTVREMVGAPGDYKLVSLIAMGYPATVPAPTKRPLGEVLHWEEF